MAAHLASAGQIQIINTVPLTNIDPDEIRAVLSEYKMSSASVAIHQPDATLEDLIDVVEGNRWASQSSSVVWWSSADRLRERTIQEIYPGAFRFEQD